MTAAAPALSSRLGRVKPSSTLAMTSKVLELQQKGVEVIGFAAGEPDFPTWQHVCEAAHQAIRGGDGLALKLLEGAEVGVVGGNDFGSADHFRILYATSMELIEQGMDKIERYLRSP